MSSTRHRRAGELFLRASGLSPAERHDLLDRECGDDDELRRQVEALLSADDDGDGLRRRLQHLGDVTREALDGTVLRPEARVGRYRIIELVGIGGMGSVYRAEPDDEPGRDVALKVMSLGVGGPNARRRFTRERQILARLRHPGIARLLEGGTTEDDRPYLAMEFVRGVPIDRSLDQRRVGVRPRLELFLEVCDAVAFAHRQLVLHRDLKPSNVLVTDAGVVKLLDFGIAQIVDAAGHAAHSSGGTLELMTPRYASPEQLRGEPVGVASDVYSLCVLLYELLCGHVPYPATSRSRGELERAIERGRARKPSVAAPTDLENVDELGSGIDRCPAETLAERRDTSPHRLARTLEGDLDAIVMRGLRPEPHRRYESVEQLVQELRLYLGGFPVTARSGELGYRIDRFVRRHWRAASVLAAALVVALVGTVLGVAGLLEARETYTLLTDLHREKVRTIITALPPLTVGSTGVPRPASLPSSWETLDAATLRELADLYELERDVLLKNDSPDAALDRALAAAHCRIGLLEHDRGSADDLAELSIALVKVGDLYFEVGDFAVAKECYHEAFTIDRVLVGRNPDEVGLLDNLFWSYDRLRGLARRQGHDELEGRYVDLQAMTADRLVEREPSFRRLTTAVRARLARFDRAMTWRNVEAALVIGEETLGLARSLASPPTQEAEHASLLCNALTRLIPVYLRTDRLADAERAIDEVESLVGRARPFIGPSREIQTRSAIALWRGDLAARQGDLEEATKHYRRAGELRALLLDRGPQALQLLAATYRGEARLHRSAGRPRAAAEMMRTSIALMRSAAEQTADEVEPARALAWCLLDESFPETYDPDEALRIITRLVDRDRRFSIDQRTVLAAAQFETGQPKAALRTLDEVLARVPDDTPLERQLREVRARYRSALGPPD